MAGASQRANSAIVALERERPTMSGGGGKWGQQVANVPGLIDTSLANSGQTS